MKFNLIPPKEKPTLSVKDMGNHQWFEVKGKHFIRIGIHDGGICCFGRLVDDNSNIYAADFLGDNDGYDCEPCFNLEEQMLVYVYKHLKVEAYGEFEINLFHD